MSFLNVEKYPPSLLYLMLTLGLAMMMLSLSDGKGQRLPDSISLIGRVPMFYYVTHIFAIHIVALAIVSIAGYPWQTMIFIGSNGNASPLLKGHFGLTLGQVYFCWMFIVLLLYPLCSTWHDFKAINKKKWWASYV
jgi:hypothetical protein